ncbi:MAG: choice-of-anchor V domain-containing protein [Candidatus Binatia bacterium]
MKRTSALVMLVIGAFVLHAATADANSAGISGRSKAGCGGGGCHGTAPSSDTSVTLTAPGTIAPGGSTPITVTVTSAVPIGGINQGGFNLSSTAGQFTALTGTQAFSAVEVGHATSGNNQRSWTVNWSPAGLCEFDLFAASNAVDGDGLQTSADHWNLATASVALAATADAAPPATPVFNRPIAGSVYLAGSRTAQGLPLTLVIGGPIVVEVTALDNVGIDHVKVTDVVNDTSTDLPAATYNANTKRFTTSWNPVTPGQHTLTAESVDCNGNASQATFSAFVL